MNACDMIYSNYLVHHGIKGQKWGVRRYQNKDGTLTEAGKKRYSVNGASQFNEAVSFIRQFGGAEFFGENLTTWAVDGDKEEKLRYYYD